MAAIVVLEDELKNRLTSSPFFKKHSSVILITNSIDEALKYSQGKMPVATFSTPAVFLNSSSSSSENQKTQKRNNMLSKIAHSSSWKISSNIAELEILAREHAEGMIEKIEEDSNSNNNNKGMHFPQEEELTHIAEAIHQQYEENKNHITKLEQRFTVQIHHQQPAVPSLLLQLVVDDDTSDNENNNQNQSSSMIDFSFGCDQCVRKIQLIKHRENDENSNNISSQPSFIIKIPHKETIKIFQEQISCSIANQCIPTPLPPPALSTSSSSSSSLAQQQYLSQQCMKGIPLFIVLQALRDHLPDELQRKFPFVDIKTTTTNSINKDQQKQEDDEESNNTDDSNKNTNNKNKTNEPPFPVEALVRIYKEIGRMIATMHNHSVSPSVAQNQRKDFPISQFTTTVSHPLPPPPNENDSSSSSPWIFSSKFYSIFNSATELESGNMWIAGRILSHLKNNSNNKDTTTTSTLFQNVIKNAPRETNFLLNPTTGRMKDEFFDIMVELDANDLFEKVPQLFGKDKTICQRKVRQFHIDFFDELEKTYPANDPNKSKSVLAHQDLNADNIILKGEKHKKRNDDEKEDSSSSIIINLVPQFIDFGDAGWNLRETEFPFLELYGLDAVWNALVDGYAQEEDSSLFGGVKLNKKLIFMINVKRCFWCFRNTDARDVTRRRREFAILKMQFDP